MLLSARRLCTASVIALVVASVVPAAAQAPPAPAPPPAAPDPETPTEPAPPAAPNVCLDAFVAAQRLRREGHLRASLADLERCGASECPTAVASKCVMWLGEVRASIPTIVVAVRDAPGGKDWTDAVVTIDGTAAADALSGRPIQLDPGPHVVRAQRRQRVVEQRFLVAEGERGRSIELVIARPFVPSPPEAPRNEDEERPNPISPLVFVGFGVALVGTAIGIGTGVAALDSASSLEETCGGKACVDTQANRDDYDAGVVAANVSTASFIIAGLGAGLGVVGVALTVSSSQRTTAYVAPTGAGLRGSF